MSDSDQTFVGILKKFNRKERNLLIRDVLGRPEEKLHLGQDFLDRVNCVLGVSLTANAWWATDYHFDWLFAAAKLFLQRASLNFPQENGSEPMTWTQEDADLVIADNKHLVLIEAKAYGAYDNEQFERKRLRFDQLCQEMEGSGIELRFLLMSPRKPQKLRYPSGVEPFKWLELKLDPKTVVCRVERCDASGKRAEKQGYWQILELPVAKASDGSEGP